MQEAYKINTKEKFHCPSSSFIWETTERISMKIGLHWKFWGIINLGSQQ